MQRFTNIVLMLPILVLAACGGSGGASTPGAAPTSTMIEERYDSGQLKSRGSLITDDQGKRVRSGFWTEWHENGEMQFEGTYVVGDIADDTYWREWNDDGSIRVDWTDR